MADTTGPDFAFTPLTAAAMRDTTLINYLVHAELREDSEWRPIGILLRRKGSPFVDRMADIHAAIEKIRLATADVLDEEDRA